jgi:hypothetical protein
MSVHFLVSPRCMNIQSDVFGNQIIELERIGVVGPLVPPTCSLLSAADRFQPRASRPERSSPIVTPNTTSVARRTADRRGCLFNAERDAIQVCDCRARLHGEVQDAMRSRALALLETSGWCSSVQGAADTLTAQVRSLR